MQLVVALPVLLELSPLHLSPTLTALTLLFYPAFPLSAALALFLFCSFVGVLCGFSFCWALSLPQWVKVFVCLTFCRVSLFTVCPFVCPVCFGSAIVNVLFYLCRFCIQSVRLKYRLESNYRPFRALVFAFALL